MAAKCTALNSKGKPCSCFARLDDPAQLCMFHSRLSAPGIQRQAAPLTKDDLLKMIDALIRKVKNAKKLAPLERSRELRALIIERDKLLVEEPAAKEPDPWRTEA